MEISDEAAAAPWWWETSTWDSPERRTGRGADWEPPCEGGEKHRPAAPPGSQSGPAGGGRTMNNTRGNIGRQRSKYQINLKRFCFQWTKINESGCYWELWVHYSSPGIHQYHDWWTKLSGSNPAFSVSTVWEHCELQWNVSSPSSWPHTPTSWSRSSGQCL